VAEPVAWLALVAAVPDGADLAAPVLDGGEDAGWLCAWLLDPDAPGGRRRPVRDAVRCPAGLVGPGEGPWVVSLTLPERGARPIHDDPAVVAATRAAARDGGRLAFTAGLVADEVHWAGGLSGVDEATAAGWPSWTSVDPWHRLGPSRLLTVGLGVLRVAALPASPGHQRRGGAPWPAGTFAP
jgi:hypothetical protein